MHCGGQACARARSCMGCCCCLRACIATAAGRCCCTTPYECDHASCGTQEAGCTASRGTGRPAVAEQPGASSFTTIHECARKLPASSMSHLGSGGQLAAALVQALHLAAEAGRLFPAARGRALGSCCHTTVLTFACLLWPGRAQHCCGMMQTSCMSNPATCRMGAYLPLGRGADLAGMAAHWLRHDARQHCAFCP